MNNFGFNNRKQNKYNPKKAKHRQAKYIFWIGVKFIFFPCSYCKDGNRETAKKQNQCVVIKRLLMSGDILRKETDLILDKFDKEIGSIFDCFGQKPNTTNQQSAEQVKNKMLNAEKPNHSFGKHHGKKNE